MRRSPKEIAFRLRQEAANLRLWLSPPRLPEGIRPGSPLPGLPDPGGIATMLRGSAFEDEITRLAEQMIRHQYPLFGNEVRTGPNVDWRRDYVNGQASGLRYFRLVPYLSLEAVGDHKVVWELNRHQHLVTLAQAWRLSGRRDAAAEIESQLESWWAQNPFCTGINWSSALEVAFRAFSWIWVWHLAGDSFTPAWSHRFIESLYQHGRYIGENLSVYFSPNTHLLGEAVVLHALGRLFPELPEADEWRTTGRDITLAQIDAQTFADGAHFEKSSYYHVYAVDLFLFHAILEKPPASYIERLIGMAEYLYAIAGPAGQTPLLGDDDGGRLFHPYGERQRFGRASLAACAAFLARPEWLRDPADLNELAAWWLGPERTRLPGVGRPFTGSRLFRESGLAIMGCGGTQLVMDVRAFGAAGAGHSHAHALSVVCRKDGTDVLIDPGTYTYVGDAEWRSFFRSTAAHNTLQIDGVSQADEAGPFRWSNKPDCEIRCWTSSATEDFIDAECRYRGFTHRRRIRFLKPDVFVIVDTVEGPPGEYSVKSLVHCGDKEALRYLALHGNGEVEEGTGWRSCVFGRKEPIPVLTLTMRGNLPMSCCQVIDTSGRWHSVQLDWVNGDAAVSIDGSDVQLKLLPS